MRYLSIDDSTMDGLYAAAVASMPPPHCPSCGEQMQSHACRYRSCRREYRQRYRHRQVAVYRRALIVAVAFVAVLAVVAAFAATLGATS